MEDFAGALDNFAVGSVVSDEQGFFGTVQWTGQLPGKRGDWVGILWDEKFPKRGKSDGSVDGCRLFNPPAAGLSASFLKVSRVSICADFLTTFLQRYQLGSGGNTWSSKEENDFYRASLAQRTSLAMDSCGIYRFSADESSEAGCEEEVRRMCPSVASLSLSKNRLHDWQDVRRIVAAFDSCLLTELNLGGNRMLGDLTLWRLQPSDSSVPCDPLHSLQVLCLRECGICSFQVTMSAALSCCPLLEDLDLGHNGIATLASAPQSNLYAAAQSELPHHNQLRKLRLDGNAITFVGERGWRSLAADVLPALDLLDLNGNPIIGIDADEELPKAPAAALNVSTLFLSDTAVDSWKTVDVAMHNPFFARIRVLTCRRWPLFRDDDGQAHAASVMQDRSLDRRHMLLARLPEVITTLNGACVNSSEREDAERYAIRYFDAKPGAVESTGGPELRRLLATLLAKHGPIAPLANVDMTSGPAVVCVTALNFQSGCMAPLDVDIEGSTLLSVFNSIHNAVGPFSSGQVDAYLLRASHFGGAERLYDEIAASTSPLEWVKGASTWPPRARQDEKEAEAQCLLELGHPGAVPDDKPASELSVCDKFLRLTRMFSAKGSLGGGGRTGKPSKSASKWKVRGISSTGWGSVERCNSLAEHEVRTGDIILLNAEDLW